jgi:hypothetical protein
MVTAPALSVLPRSSSPTTSSHSASRSRSWAGARVSPGVGPSCTTRARARTLYRGLDLRPFCVVAGGLLPRAALAPVGLACAVVRLENRPQNVGEAVGGLGVSSGIYAGLPMRHGPGSGRSSPRRAWQQWQRSRSARDRPGSAASERIPANWQFERTGATGRERSLTDRTQEVAGSSPASSIKALFGAGEGAGGSPSRRRGLEGNCGEAAGGQP